LKKLLVVVVLAFSIFSACHSTTSSFREVEDVPNHVQDKIDRTYKLQSINNSGKGYYIVFHSSGDVEVEVETQGESVTIRINEANLHNESVKQYTYYLTTDQEHDVLNVLVNGESMPFDNVTIL